MTRKYLLPCVCGLETAVEPRQAGETVNCACGSPLQVPAMRELANLEVAPPELASSLPPAAKAWGTSQRFVLLGTAVALAAIVAAMVMFIVRPVSPFSVIDPELIRRTAHRMPAPEAWNAWETMKQQGLDRRTDQKYENDEVKFYVWEGVAGTATLIGLGLIAVGLLTAKGQAMRRT